MIPGHEGICYFENGRPSEYYKWGGEIFDCQVECLKTKKCLGSTWLNSENKCTLHMNFKEDSEFEILKEKWKTRGSHNFIPNDSSIQFDRSKNDIGVCFIPAPGKIYEFRD